MIGTKVFAVAAGENVYFKLENEEILKLIVIEHEVTNFGEGSTGLMGSKSMGIHLRLNITEEQLELLAKHKIIKTRIVTTDGYNEAVVKEKQANNVIGISKLILK